MDRLSRNIRDPGPGTRWRLTIVRASLVAALIACAMLAWPAVSSKVSIELGRLPQVNQRSLAIFYLDSLLVAYLLAWFAVVIGFMALAVRAVRMRRVNRLVARAEVWQSKLVLLGVSVLASLLLVECGAAAWQSWLHRRPQLPSANSIAAPLMPRLPESLATARTSDRDQSLRILVIGESSGRGEPYHPSLSVGQIVAWYLEPVFPGRKISVDIWAVGGAILEDMHKKLAGLTYRPDALIVYVGHNEFIGRYSWNHEIDFYDDDFSGWALPRGLNATLDGSPLCRLILANRERQRMNVAPDRFITRERVDRPICGEAQSARILVDFRTRLSDITRFCESIGTLPILIIPASGDAILDPSRSILSPTCGKRERAAFAREAAKAALLERTDPDAAIKRYRELITAHPEFADLHFRLAELLNRQGDWAEARTHYIMARENDALPARCREAFRQAYRDVAAQHRSAVLIDGPAVLEAASRHGILDEALFHDGQHPNLRGYVALSQNVLNQLCDRHLLGWPSSVSVPQADPVACEKHFGIDARFWAEVCRRESRFYQIIANVRFDPRARNLRGRDYQQAATRIESGVAPADAGIPGWEPPSQQSEFNFIPVPAIGTGARIAWPGR